MESYAQEGRFPASLEIFSHASGGLVNNIILSLRPPRALRDDYFLCYCSCWLVWFVVKKWIHAMLLPPIDKPPHWPYYEIRKKYLRKSKQNTSWCSI